MGIGDDGAHPELLGHDGHGDRLCQRGLYLMQAAGIIMGAEIGTTITAQIIAIKLTDVAPVFVFAGVIIVLTFKSRAIKRAGEIITDLASCSWACRFYPSGAAAGNRRVPQFYGEFSESADRHPHRHAYHLRDTELLGIHQHPAGAGAAGLGWGGVRGAGVQHRHLHPMASRQA